MIQEQVRDRDAFALVTFSAVAQIEKNLLRSGLLQRLDLGGDFLAALPLVSASTFT